MSIKGWIGIGISGLALIGMIFEVRKRRIQSNEKIEQIVKNVDLKEETTKEEEKTVEDIVEDVDQAVQEMELDELVEKVHHEMNDTEEELEEFKKAKRIKKQCNDILNEKYNPYPYHPAPYGPYGQALSEGVITEEFYKEAEKHYGKMWTYSGD